jgi:hypothetical protein
MSTTQTPAVPAAVTHAVPTLPSLTLPGASLLTTNTRPFSGFFEVTATGVHEVDLLDLPHVKQVAEGFSSARVVGPFQVKLVGVPGTAATQLAIVTVGIMDTRWPTPTVRGARRIPDSVNVAASLLKPTDDGLLPFPETFKSNLKVFQNAGVVPCLVIATSLVGFAAVTVEVTGLVELAGTLPLCPWPAPEAAAE